MSPLGSLVLLTVLLQVTQGQLPPQQCVFDPRASKTPTCDCSCRDGKDGRDGRDGRDGKKIESFKFRDLANELETLKAKLKDMESKLVKLGELESDALSYRAARASKDDDKKSQKGAFFDAYKKELEMLELMNTTEPHKKTVKVEQPAIPDMLANMHGDRLQTDRNGKLPQTVLPAGYDKMSLADVQWQSLHMSAASACRGLSKSGGHPGIHNVVLLRNAKEGKTCRNLCSKSWADKCEGEVSIWGMPGKGNKNGQEIGNFYNYGCDYGTGGGSEADVKPEAILQGMKEAHQFYFSYCCCSFY